MQTRPFNKILVLLGVTAAISGPVAGKVKAKERRDPFNRECLDPALWTSTAGIPHGQHKRNRRRQMKAGLRRTPLSFA